MLGLYIAPHSFTHQIIIATDKEKFFPYEAIPPLFPNHSQNTQVVVNLRILVLVSFVTCQNG